MAKKKTATTKKKTAAPKKKTGAAKSTPKKTAAPAKKTAAKKAAPKKAPAKTAAPKKKVGKGSEPLFRSFDRWRPESPFSPPADDRAGYAAPPFDAGISKEILFRKFDVDFADAAKPPKAPAKPKKPAAKAKPASPPRKPATREELLRRDFGAWKPAAPYAPPAGDEDANYAAPGFGAGVARDVLFRKFDDVDFAAIAKPPKPAPPPRKPATREELLRRDFGAWKPAAPYAPPAGDEDANYAAPGFGAGVARDVLLRKFDDVDFAAIAKPPKPPAPPREPVPREELIRRDFGAWKPETLYAPPPADEAAKFSAPPMNDGASSEIRFRKFDFDFETPAREAEEKRAAAPDEKAGDASGASSDETVIKLSETKERDPMDRNITFLAAGVVLLFILIGAASFSNSGRYYVEPTDDGVQIWKGRFSPLGRKLLADLEGLAPPEPLRPVYSREAALTLAFDHFMGKVNQKLEDPTRINFDQLETLLDRAGKFAATEDQKIALDRRQTDLRLTTYLFRANTAAGRGDRKGFSKAADLLEEAALLKLSPGQTAFVERQIELLNDMKNATPETPEAPREKRESPAPEADGHGAAPGEEAAEPEGHGASLDL